MQQTEQKPPIKTDKTSTISLSLNQRPLPTTSVPLSFRPIKDNYGVDYFPSHAFDANNLKPISPLIASQVHRIDLPYSKAFAHSSYHLPISQKPLAFSKLLKKNAILEYFKRIADENNATFSVDAIKVITQNVSVLLCKIVLAAGQSSRQRTNYYVPPVSERQITLSPKISQYFLSLELCYSNTLRKHAFVPNTDADEDDRYEPLFLSIDLKKNQPFLPSENSNEALETRHQIYKITNQLKQIGTMNKNFAHENEGYTYLKEVENVSSKFKSQPQPKVGQFSAHAAEVFGGKAEEDQKLNNRRIEPRDVFYSLNFFPKCIRAMEQKLRQSYFAEDEIVNKQ
ncbi:hypothetical protein GPJ56_004237 [Histomonas meleagridis]|uniref:uncharacterized protein n=1 Tax=Histomonas meleagridis TaxID=135588 RepID=UPI00355A1C9C|nr:hypothetical protein GPJ56_004237 [Histomonas meleagridis]KAH0802214.1 hypothetical protein GO595_004827 [Histomonas meleagridis]